MAEHSGQLEAVQAAGYWLETGRETCVTGEFEKGLESISGDSKGYEEAG